MYIFFHVCNAYFGGCFPSLFYVALQYLSLAAAVSPPFRAHYVRIPKEREREEEKKEREGEREGRGEERGSQHPTPNCDHLFSSLFSLSLRGNIEKVINYSLEE